MPLDDTTPYTPPRDNPLEDRFDRSRDAWQDQYFKDRPDWTVDPLDRLNPPKDDPYRK